MSKKNKGPMLPCKNAPNCNGQVRAGAKDREGSKILDCPSCRQVKLGWIKRRTPTEVLRYVTELRKRSIRMEEVRDDRDIEFKPTYRR